MNANFENYARKQIGSHEVDVDTDALWASIQPHVSPQSGNKRTLWFFLLGLLLGLTVFGVFYINKDSQSVIATQAEDNPSASNEIASTIAVSPEDRIEEKIAANSLIKETEDTKVDENENINSESKTNLAETIDARANNTTTKEAKKDRISKDRKTTSASVVNSNSTIGNDPKNVINKNQNEGSSLVNDIDVQVDVSPVISLDKQGGDLIVETKKNRLSGLNSLPTLFPSRLHSEKEFPIGFLDGYKTISSKSLATNKKRRRRGSIIGDLRFGLGLYTGLTSAAADLEANTEAADDYLILRANSEKQLESLHFGLSAIVETESDFYLRTGVEYTRIASLFSRASEQTVVDSIPGIVEIQINQVTGDTVEIEGLVQRTTITKFTKKSYNYFHLVDVPIILGYNFGDYDDDWRIGIEAGVYANVFMKRKGEISLADGDFYDISDDNNNWYKNNIGISPFIGINAAYNVSQNIQLHFSPSFRFKSVYSTDDSLIKERHASLGVQAGVRYFLD